MITLSGDDTPIIGGDVPADMLRPFTIDGPMPADDLGRHVVRLLALHPHLVDFSMRDLSRMNDNTKRLLISDINDALGIRPLRTR